METIESKRERQAWALVDEIARWRERLQIDTGAVDSDPRVFAKQLLLRLLPTAERDALHAEAVNVAQSMPTAAGRREAFERIGRMFGPLTRSRRLAADEIAIKRSELEELLDRVSEVAIDLACVTAQPMTEEERAHAEDDDYWRSLDYEALA